MPLAPQELRTFFITAVTANRRRLFQIKSNAELLLNLFNEDRAKNRYQLHAFVIMPDHIHLLITPSPDISIEKAMQFIKGGFSFRLQSKRDVWQSEYQAPYRRRAGLRNTRDIHPRKSCPRSSLRNSQKLPTLISRGNHRNRSRTRTF